MDVARSTTVRYALSGVAAVLLLRAGGLLQAQEEGPFPTGIPTYAQAASALLPPAASSGQQTAILKYLDVGANLEGSFLSYRAEKPGDYLMQDIEVKEEGTHQLVLWAPKGPRCGMFVTVVDGERVGPERDGYAAEAEGPTSVELGEVELTAGTHRVHFLVTGRNPESAGHELWIDSYVVRPKPAGRFIETWEVAGPFGGDGLAATAPPEGSFWRQVTATNGRLDFIKWMGAADNAAAWARAVIDSPEDQETTLWVGSDDGVAVWLNGEKLHEYLEARPALPDQDMVPARLKKGRNQLLVRVNNISLGWELLVRPQDPFGQLGLSGAEAAQVRPDEAVPLGEAKTTGLPARELDRPAEGEKRDDGDVVKPDGEAGERDMAKDADGAEREEGEKDKADGDKANPLDGEG